jgi:hypothetical protein
MSRSIWTIAELVWRQLNPGGKEEAKHTLEEYVETAKDEYADIAFSTWLQLRNDKDLSLIENLLHRQEFEVKENSEGKYSELDISIMDLPRDMGVFRVQPPKQGPMTKTTLGTKDLFQGDPGEYTYYRTGTKVFYPDGFAIPETKKVLITYVSSDLIDDDLSVPEIFASRISNALRKAYGPTLNIPADTTNNKNPDQ